MFRKNLIQAISLAILFGFVIGGTLESHNWMFDDPIIMDYTDPIDSKHQDEKQEEKAEKEGKDKIRVYIDYQSPMDALETSNASRYRGLHQFAHSEVITPPPELIS